MSRYSKDKCKEDFKSLYLNLMTCSSKMPFYYCSDVLPSYGYCEDYCESSNKTNPEFCKKVCNFDPDWKFSSFDNMGNAWFYNPKSIFISQNNIEIWIKSIYSKEGKTHFKEHFKFLGIKEKEWEKINEHRALIKFDCIQKKE
jgi:hypothetical protein